MNASPSFPRRLAAVLAGVAGVTCGTRHCLALLNDGTVRAWGEGRSGELGHGVPASSALPVTVSALTGVTLAREFTPQVLNPAANASAIMNLPPADQWGPSKFDVLMIEDYDWVTGEAA